MWRDWTVSERAFMSLFDLIQTNNWSPLSINHVLWMFCAKWEIEDVFHECNKTTSIELRQVWCWYENKQRKPRIIKRPVWHGCQVFSIGIGASMASIAMITRSFSGISAKTCSLSNFWNQTSKLMPQYVHCTNKWEIHKATMQKQCKLWTSNLLSMSVA